MGYIYSVKVSGLDAALRTAFDTAIAVNPAIKVVADGSESFYTGAAGPQGGPGLPRGASRHQRPRGRRPGSQRCPWRRGPDQGGRSSATAARANAIQNIADGKQFGTVVQLPATEGRLGVEQLVNAIRTGAATEGIDTLATLPDGGVVTKANVEQFLTLAEWPG